MERQKQALGLEGQEKRVQIQCMAQSTMPLGLGREQRCHGGSDVTKKLIVLPPQTSQELF